MSRRKVDYVYVPKKKIKKVVIDAKKGRKSVEKTVNQRQILDGAYVRASAMKEFPNGKFAKGGSVGDEFKETFVVDVYSELGDDSYTIEATDGKQAFEEARYLFKKENPQYKGQIDLSMRDKYAKGGSVKKAVTSTEYISKEEIKRFEDYVYDVYEEYGFTKPQVIQAVKKYVNHLEPNTQQAFTWGGGDSLDRERVYEYLLDPKLNRIKNPTFEKGGETGENTRYSVQVRNTAAYPRNKERKYYIETTNKERAEEIALEKFKKEFGTQRGISVYVNSVSVVPTEDGKERTRKYFIKIRNVKGSEKESYIIDAYAQDVAIDRAFKKFRAQYNRPPAQEDDPNVFLTQIDDAYPIAEIRQDGVTTYKRKFAEGGITKSHISVGDIVLDKNDNKYYIVYEVKNGVATNRYFLPDVVAESIAFEQNPELIDWNKYTMYSDERLNANFSVGDMVYVESVRKSGVIVGISSKSNGDMYYSVKFANDTVDHFSEYELELISTLKRGGNIGSYNKGRSWKQDHYRHNKSESYEIPMDDRKFAKGGQIKNQYANKSVEQVWNMWTPEQKDHFLSDHFNYDGDADFYIRKQMPELIKMSWAKVQEECEYAPEIYYTLEEHIGMGQYKRGGNIGNYNSGRSWKQDHYRHNKSESYEIPMNDRKYAKGGMTKFNGYKKIGLLDENDYNSWSQKEKERMYFVQIQVPTKDSRGFRNAYKNTVSIVEADNKKDALEVGKILFKQEHPNTSLVGATVKYAEKLSDKITDMLQISILDSEGQVNQEFYRLVKMRNVPNVEVEKFITAYKNNDPKITDFVKDGLYFRSFKGGSPYGYAKGGEIPDLTNMNIDHLFANGGRTYPTTEEKIYS